MKQLKMKNKTYRRKTRLSEFPTELLQNILCRLSVKTIYHQVRFVCKTWYAIVNDPSFISMHADWWAKNHYGYLIFHHNTRIARLDKWFNFSEELEYPIMGSELQLIGSCNGLLCLRDRYVNHRENLCFSSTYLWNPCIKGAFKKLQDVPFSLYHIKYDMRRCISAFGFDSQNNDYKVFHTVLGVICYKDDKYVIVNWLYSLKTNSWKVIRGAEDDHDRPSSYRSCRKTYPSRDYTSRTSSNGAFYWTSHKKRRNSSCIMWFDFCDETIRKINLPIDYEARLYLATFKNSLVVYVSDMFQKAPCTTLNAWMMKKSSDHTAMWSWDEKLSAAIPSMKLIKLPSVKPLNIGLNGEFLVLTYMFDLDLAKLFYKLGVYDFKEQKLREGDIHFIGDYTFHDSFSHSESLVLLQDACRGRNNNQPTTH